MGNNSVPKFIFRLSRFPVYRGSVLGRFYCNSLKYSRCISHRFQPTKCVISVEICFANYCHFLLMYNRNTRVTKEGTYYPNAISKHNPMLQFIQPASLATFRFSLLSIWTSSLSLFKAWMHSGQNLLQGAFHTSSHSLATLGIEI